MICLTLTSLLLGFSSGASVQLQQSPLETVTKIAIPNLSAPSTSVKNNPAEAEALTQLLRSLLKKHLPDPLVTLQQNWGHQKAVTVVHRRREGLRVWTMPVQELRNDGVWRRITIRIPHPDQLALAVTELTHPEAGRINITVAHVVERIDFRIEQQVWRNGLRLYSGETRGHCKAGLLLRGEVVTQTTFKKGSFLPDVKITLKANGAELFYDKLEIDHTAGVGGDLAEIVGDSLIRLAKTLKPDLEKELIEKANTAIVKAAGTREFKGALDQLVQSKPKNGP
jgi:hypothetical protein